MCMHARDVMDEECGFCGQQGYIEDGICGACGTRQSGAWYNRNDDGTWEKDGVTYGNNDEGYNPVTGSAYRNGGNDAG